MALSQDMVKCVLVQTMFLEADWSTNKAVTEADQDTTAQESSAARGGKQCYLTAWWQLAHWLTQHSTEPPSYWFETSQAAVAAVRNVLRGVPERERWLLLRLRYEDFFPTK
jgi:hypothetical protein